MIYFNGQHYCIVVSTKVCSSLMPAFFFLFAIELNFSALHLELIFALIVRHTLASSSFVVCGNREKTNTINKYVMEVVIQKDIQLFQLQ